MRQFDHTSPLLDSARPPRPFTSSRSEPAIIGFAAFSLLGAIAMSYYCHMDLGETSGGLRPAADVAVYEGKAVPRDEARRPVGAAFLAMPRRRTAADAMSSVDAGAAGHRNPSEPREANAVAADRDGQSTYSFPELESLDRAADLGSASTVAANVSAQSGLAGIEAPISGPFAPVPESNGWSFAGALLLLLGVAERLRKRAPRRS